MKNLGAVVTCVVTGSLAEELGIEPGDKILTVNGQHLEDVIDLRFMLSDECIELELEKSDGEIWVLETDKDYDEELGVELAADTFDGIRRCHNKCVFCFVDQMPPKMRETLYVKDDDYRLSFLRGNFITGTNINEDDLRRILNMRLSPIYLSVHTTNPELRQKMLNSPKAGKIMEQLSTLVGNGIEVHTQVVLCPGYNDGEELERTISDLSKMWPGVRSIAIVPVGLTNYRDGLIPLATLNKESANTVIHQVTHWQEKMAKEIDYPLVFLGDEFYLLADRSVPDNKWYADYPQTENGVGLVRILYDSFSDLKAQLPASLAEERNYLLLTGTSGAKVLEPIVARLNEIEGLHIQVKAITNNFFGQRVTVAGLITGIDILDQLSNVNLAGEILIPSVMVKQGEEVFLDGMAVSQLAERLGVPISIISTAEGAVDLVNKVTR